MVKLITSHHHYLPSSRWRPKIHVQGLRNFVRLAGHGWSMALRAFFPRIPPAAPRAPPFPPHNAIGRWSMVGTAQPLLRGRRWVRHAKDDSDTASKSGTKPGNFTIRV